MIAIVFLETSLKKEFTSKSVEESAEDLGKIIAHNAMICTKNYKILSRQWNKTLFHIP